RAADSDCRSGVLRFDSAVGVDGSVVRGGAVQDVQVRGAADEHDRYEPVADVVGADAVGDCALHSLAHLNSVEIILTGDVVDIHSGCPCARVDQDASRGCGADVPDACGLYQVGLRVRRLV